MNAVGPQARQEEIERYLNGVRSALADMPEETRNELLEDLPAHLAEVANESPEPLEERLGAPAAYARELCAAAGLDAGSREARQGASPGFTRMALSEFKDALRPARAAVARLLRPVDVNLGRMLGYERSVDFLVQLIPAWWVLRGYVVAMFVLGVLFGHQGLTPSTGGGDLLGYAFVLGCVVLSVRVGPLVRRLPGIARLFANGVTAILVLILAANVLSIDYRFDDTVGYEPSPYGHIVDLYPYDTNGQPLTGVRLFDQNGSQVTVGDPYRCQTVAQPLPGEPESGERAYAYPLCPWPGSTRPAFSQPVPRSPSVPVSPSASVPLSASVSPSVPVSPSAPVPPRSGSNAPASPTP